MSFTTACQLVYGLPRLLRLERRSLPHYSSLRIAIEKLLDPTTQRNCVIKLHNRFELIYESGKSASSIENIWKEGRNALKETSHAVLGPRRTSGSETTPSAPLASTAQPAYVATRSWQDVLLPNANNNYDVMRMPGTAA